MLMPAGWVTCIWRKMRNYAEYIVCGIKEHQVATFMVAGLIALALLGMGFGMYRVTLFMRHISPMRTFVPLYQVIAFPTEIVSYCELMVP